MEFEKSSPGNSQIIEFDEQCYDNFNLIDIIISGFKGKAPKIYTTQIQYNSNVMVNN